MTNKIQGKTFEYQFESSNFSSNMNIKTNNKHNTDDDKNLIK